MFILLIVILSFAGYWRIFEFTFWKDDWWLLWSGLYNVAGLRDWLHPGTPIEFMILSSIFGTHPFLWQLTGFILHVCVSLALAAFVRTLVENQKVGILAGLFYAASFAGMDAVGWPSAHVVLFVSLMLLVGLRYFTMYVRSRTHLSLTIALLYICIALVFDPFRTLPVFLILPLIIKIIAPKDKTFFTRFFQVELLTMMVILWAVVSVLGYHIVGSQLVTHITGYIQNPVQLLRHIYIVGNYFNSIANLLFGWVIRFPEDGSTGIYSSFWARIGFFVFCVTTGIAYAYIKYSRRLIGIILFGLSWMFIFYLPNWMFEPRLTMGGTHRYMVLSAVGFIALVSYLVSQLKDRVILISVSFIFITANVFMANYFWVQAAHYRSAKHITAFWRQIDSDVPEKLTRIIFMFSGEDPTKTYGLSLSGPYPYAFNRHIINRVDLPIVTEDRDYLDKLICEEEIPLNHIFSWSVTNEGQITNRSSRDRLTLLIHALDHDCVPVIDRGAMPKNTQ